MIDKIQEILVGMQLSNIIQTSDLMNWIFGATGGILVFRAVDNMQTNIERHSMIKDIENTINEIFSNQIAKSNVEEDGDSSECNGNELRQVTLRTVLHDKSPWEKYSKENSKIRIDEGQRYIRIRNRSECEEYVATQALHEMLIVFRRIEKLYKNSILKPLDLADMWREILPFGTSGRLEFFASYFGDKDIESMYFVIMNTLVACEENELKRAVEYFKSEYNLEKSSLKHFKENKRLRFRDYKNRRKFEKVMTS